MIKYNIDNHYLNIIEEQHKMMVMIVEGWAYSDSSSDIDFKINIDEPYRIERFVREDVNKNFNLEDSNVFLGFR